MRSCCGRRWNRGRHLRWTLYDRWTIWHLRLWSRLWLWDRLGGDGTCEPEPVSCVASATHCLFARIGVCRAAAVAVELDGRRGVGDVSGGGGVAGTRTGVGVRSGGGGATPAGF